MALHVVAPAAEAQIGPQPSTPLPPGMASPDTADRHGLAGPTGTGLLAIEIDASDTRVLVDGVDMGAAAFPGQPPRPLPLPPGVHHVRLARPGSAPVDFTVEIAPGRTSVVRWQTPPAARESGDGYRVIPPRATDQDRPAEGSGYFVVPKP